MTEIVMTSIEKLIFGLICSGVLDRKVLIASIKERKICSEPTLDRILKKGIKTWGFLAKGKRGSYCLSRKGREYQKSIEVKPEITFKNSGLAKVIDKLPTQAHRGMVHFILAVITAKRYLWNDFEHFWPGFIINGGTGDIKTLLGQICCQTLGLSQVKHIQRAIKKTQAQVLGEAIYQKGQKRGVAPADYFSYIFITWDELDKADNKVTWTALLVYLDGDREVEERDTRIEKRVTCLVTMNPKKARFDVPDYYIRRAFTVNSANLPCDPKEAEIIAAEIMDKPIPRLKIDALPVVIRKLSKSDKDFMRDLLYREDLLEKEAGKLVDTNLLEKVVLGELILQESGDVKNYIYWAVEYYLCFVETLGYTKEGWHDKLIQDWANYRLGKDPEFDKAWEEKLGQIKKDKDRIRVIKEAKEEVEIDKGAEERVILAKYAPLLDRLREIKASFSEMDGDKHHTILLYLNMDIRKFISKLPTEKRDNKVTQQTLTELEIVLDEWEGQHKLIRQVWESGKELIRKYEEKKNALLRWATKEKARLGRWRYRDSNGVLWTARVKPIIRKIGLILNPKTQKAYFNQTFLEEIRAGIANLDAEVKAQNEELDLRRKGNPDNIEAAKSMFPGLSDIEKAVDKENIQNILTPGKKQIYYYQHLWTKIEKWLEARRKEKGPPDTFDGRPWEGKKGYEGRDIDDL